MSQIPDFTVMNWKLTQSGQDFLAYDPNGRSDSLRIATEDLYINERTGEMGVNYLSLKSNLLICKTWEKKLIYYEAEKILHYLGLYTDGNWKVYRLKQPIIIAEIVKDNSRKISGARIIFTLATEEQKSFFLPIKIINA